MNEIKEKSIVEFGHMHYNHTELQVKNRSQAVLKAKELGELPKD